jgi:hypothetical protein
MAAIVKSRVNRWSGLPAVVLAAATLGCQSPIPNFGGSTLESATRVPPPPTGSYAVPGSYDSSQRIGDAAPRSGDVGHRISDSGQGVVPAAAVTGVPTSGVVPASAVQRPADPQWDQAWEQTADQTAEQPQWKLPGQP